MDTLLFFIKIAVFLELTLIVLFILMNYIVKACYFFKARSEDRQIKNIEGILVRSDEQRDSKFDLKTIKYLQRHVSLVLRLIFSYQKQQLPFVDSLSKPLSEEVFRPSARKLTASKKWFKRYLAVNCFSYGFELSDEVFLLQLISDDSLLVALNAALVALRHPTSQLINKIVDVYAKRRRLQQTAFAEILTKEAPIIQSIIGERLGKEFDPYVKTFCYHLLVDLPPTELVPSTELDIRSENIDLKIAALNYLAHVQTNAAEKIRSYLTDSHWQVRAIATKLLGQLKDRASLLLLETCLRDSEWWVRINAAQALSLIGDEGIAVLKAQDPEVDRYAYETAKKRLGGP